MSYRISLINGPNLDKLGQREPGQYGTGSYDDLLAYCRQEASDLGLDLEIAQSQHEGELVELIHAAAESCQGLVINAAGYTHTSVALRDALLCHDFPIVEVHISNPDNREDFRRENLIADVVTATVKGFGFAGYGLALRGMLGLLTDRAD
jgi:3-dehydroquinate dehydratase II